MSGISRARLVGERKSWRKDHPHGFFARPVKNQDGSTDLFKWKCGIPGKKGTDWEGGVYKLRLEFPKDYPSKPPKAIFEGGLFHPNVYPSGTVCLSILSEDQGWKPSITLRDVLLGIQDLLDNPNPNSPAQQEPYVLFVRDKAKYKLKVQEQAKRNAM